MQGSVVLEKIYAYTWQLIEIIQIGLEGES